MNMVESLHTKQRPCSFEASFHSDADVEVGVEVRDSLR